MNLNKYTWGNTGRQYRETTDQSEYKKAKHDTVNQNNCGILWLTWCAWSVCDNIIIHSVLEAHSERWNWFPKQTFFICNSTHSVDTAPFSVDSIAMAFYSKLCHRGMWVLFQLFQHLTTKEHSIATQKIGWTATYNRAASFQTQLESWWHATI